jgi:hypothetical protein
LTAGSTWAVKHKSQLFGNDMERKEDMNIKHLTGIVLFGATIVWGCKKLYAPPAITANNNYLVVEGLIAAGQDSTIIKLSRTVNVSGTTTLNPERGATVTVQDDQNVSYSLHQTDTGKYGAPPLNLDNSRKYRLNITTTDGQNYVSDYVPVKVTPPIDSVYYKIQSTTIDYYNKIQSSGLEIYADTHDPANNTRYYRWDYTETYIFQTDTVSDYILDPVGSDTLKWSRLRTPAEQIHTCYITANSSAITVNTSAALSNDVIANNVITQIPSTSEKVLHRYSILVRQYALTKDAYNFWAALKKNTQQIGTIFDAQPSANTTNLHCTSDPSRIVIGYVSASSVTQKRIFIDQTQLPHWPYNSPFACLPDFACWPKGSPPPQMLSYGQLVPMDIIRSAGCIGFTVPTYNVPVQSSACVDCRIHLGGKTVKPAFWQ